MLFRFDRVGKEFAGEWLFRRISLQCNPGDRIGLIGRNGSGKTTLFRLIRGELPPDEGAVQTAGRLRIAHIQQIASFDPQTTVYQQALEVFSELRKLERRVRQLEVEMSRLQGSVPPEQARQYEELSLKFRLQGGYDYEARARAVLLGLGFPLSLQDHSCSRLSGGQKSRLLLARALLRPADLLLLDEPTNHLDLPGVLWLIRYLEGHPLPFIVISHDRHFLDAVTRKTWWLERGSLYSYPANFSRARELHRRRLEELEAEYRRQKEWREKTEEFIRRNIAGQKTRQAQSRRKQLEKREVAERPVLSAPVWRLQITQAPRGGTLSFEIRGGRVGFPGKALLREVNLKVHRGDRLAILGGNGSGKSTLLKTLRGEVPLLDGELKWGPNHEIGYFEQEPEWGQENRTVYDLLRDLAPLATEQELRSFAARFLFRGEEIFKTVGSLSGGERSRLALARLFRISSNVLLLDEPTNHLDIEGREALEEALQEYHGTLVVVSHDLYFLKKVVEAFHLIRDGRLIPCSPQELESRLQEESAASGKPAPEKQERKSGEEAGGGKGGLSKNERARRQWHLQELESRIEALEQTQKEITAGMNEAAADFAELEKLSRQYGKNQAELQRLYEEWELTASQLAHS